MKAVIIPQFGAPDVLEVSDMPIPHPGPGEVAITVAYAGVNYAEILYRRGVVDVPLPFIPGIEVSGTIRALGEGVSGFSIGQPVAALTIVNSGGYAEVVVTSAQLTFPLDRLSQPVDWVTAAAFPSNTITSYILLSDVARINPGENILIHAAAGGVGSSLGQVARALGAQHVLGTVGSRDKLQYTQSLGYTHVALRQDFSEQWIDQLTDQGISIVIDPVGGLVRTKSLEALRPFGRLVAMGNASNDADVAISSNYLWFNNKSVIGFNLAAYSVAFPDRVQQAGRAALDLVDHGDVRMMITSVLPLERASEAHRMIESGKTVGKIVLRVGAEV